MTAAVDTAATILARIKSHDQHNIGVVTLLASDPMLGRLAASWANVSKLISPDVDPQEVCPPSMPLADRSRWLWARVEPDPAPLWISISGLPAAPHTFRCVQVLQDNGAVFPDGEMSDWALKWLAQSACSAGLSRDLVQPDHSDQ